MKMTRTKLKSLVKECLVEILSEGIKPNESALHENKRRHENQRQEEMRLTEHRKKFETRIEDTVSSLTDDNILQSILVDTAQTTLQEQMSHESSPSGGSPLSTGGDPGINLNSIFEESSDNWSRLAFSGKDN